MPQKTSNMQTLDTHQTDTSVEKISAFVVCKNEEDHLDLCLHSLSFCDEILVVDSFSTDRSLDICKAHNVKVIQREWPGYRLQKEFATQQLTHDWVLFIDADEYVSDELRDEIISLRDGTSKYKLSEYSGFFVNRVMFHFGMWWRKGGWYPEYRLRFFRKAEVKWGGKEPHETTSVSGKTATLSGELYHFSYENLKDQVSKLSSHAFVRAESDFKDGKRSSITAIITRPLTRFIKFYFFKKGYRHGTPAVVVGLTEAFYTFLKYARLWELERERNGMKKEPRTISDIKSITENDNCKL